MKTEFKVALVAGGFTLIAALIPVFSSKPKSHEAIEDSKKEGLPTNSPIQTDVTVSDSVRNSDKIEFNDGKDRVTACEVFDTILITSQSVLQTNLTIIRNLKKSVRNKKQSTKISEELKKLLDFSKHEQAYIQWSEVLNDLKNNSKEKWVKELSAELLDEINILKLYLYAYHDYSTYWYFGSVHDYFNKRYRRLDEDSRLLLIDSTASFLGRNFNDSLFDKTASKIRNFIINRNPEKFGLGNIQNRTYDIQELPDSVLFYSGIEFFLTKFGISEIDQFNLSDLDVLTIYTLYSENLRSIVNNIARITGKAKTKC